MAVYVETLTALQQDVLAGAAGVGEAWLAMAERLAGLQLEIVRAACLGSSELNLLSWERVVQRGPVAA